MNTRKFLGSVLVASLLVSSAAGATTVDGFSDIDYGHENYTAVDYLRTEGVVQGYADGSFKPDNSINRAEFLKIVMEASSHEASGSNCYPDVKSDWYAKYVCKATALGLVKGYDDGYFRPEQKINFAEASKIISNALNLDAQAQASGEWYTPYVAALEEDRAIPKSISSFDKFIDRGEMAEMIWRLKVQPENVPAITSMGIERKMEEVEADEQLLTFDSCVQLKDYLTENSSYYGYNYYGRGDEVVVMEEVAESDDSAGAVADESAAPVTDELGGGSDDYSSTNVQVEGVDEADIIKNDGEFIYILKGASVRIVKAYPPEGIAELDKVTFGDDAFYPSDMYTDGDRLIVIGYSYNPIYVDFPQYETATYPYYGSVTKVYIFDISDKNNVSVMRKLSFEGDYITSRKVDGVVYLVVNKTYSNYYFPAEEGYGEDDIIPLYGDSKTDEVSPITGCGDIRYVPGVESTSYLTVAGIPVNDADANVEEEVILGASGTVYASRENLYVAESSSYWGGWWWDEGQTNEETVIHKFALNDGMIEYKGKGNVKGTVLNQFSMDEHEGNFRVATTLGHVWDSENPSTNNVYVLNSSLAMTGKLEGIAPGETIYSVRFIGDRGYLVTFKKVDPFFVVDLSSSSNPVILGSLKIPGYSNYLHPYDENHIIGFGKDAIDASDEDLQGWGRTFDFAWYQGLKIAMFDVTDVANPVELHKVVIGDRGTDSELLYNHKALLFDKERGLMALPVTLAEIPQTVKDDPEFGDNTYGESTFQGAYVYNVSAEDGFDFKGRISHYTDAQLENFDYYWYGEEDIKRILWIGDYLYTVSYAVVQANLKADLSEVSRVELEAEPEPDYGYGDDVIY